jgi:hypothetical protein
MKEMFDDRKNGQPMWDSRTGYKFLVGKPGRKRPLGRTRLK